MRLCSTVSSVLGLTLVKDSHVPASKDVQVRSLSPPLEVSTARPLEASSTHFSICSVFRNILPLQDAWILPVHLGPSLTRFPRIHPPSWGPSVSHSQEQVSFFTCLRVRALSDPPPPRQTAGRAVRSSAGQGGPTCPNAMKEQGLPHSGCI